MKFAVLFLALVCLAIANVQATKSESYEVKEQLIKLEKQSWEAWKNRDGKFFQNFLSDDHVEVGFGGLANKAEVVAFVGSPVCTVKSYKLDRFEMKMLGKDTALLTYWEEQDTVCNKQVPSPCWVSSLYMKRGDSMFPKSVANIRKAERNIFRGDSVALQAFWRENAWYPSEWAFSPSH